MNNIFNINEQEKNRIRGLHKNYSIIKEQDDEKGDVGSIEGMSTNLLTPAVQTHLKGKKRSTIDMLKIIAGCYVEGKHGALWAGLEGGGESWSHKGGPMPIIYPGKKDGTLIGAVKTGWAEEINPCKMYKVPEGWTRSDFLVPAIVNYWTKRAKGISNIPAESALYNDEGDDQYTNRELDQMDTIGDRLTWVMDRDNGVSTMWTLTKV